MIEFSEFKRAVRFIEPDFFRKNHHQLNTIFEEFSSDFDTCKNCLVAKKFKLLCLKYGIFGKESGWRFLEEIRKNVSQVGPFTCLSSFRNSFFFFKSKLSNEIYSDN